MNRHTTSQPHSDQPALGMQKVWALANKRIARLKIRAFLIVPLITAANLMELEA